MEQMKIKNVKAEGEILFKKSHVSFARSCGVSGLNIKMLRTRMVRISGSIQEPHNFYLLMKTEIRNVVI
jgi:hypothetical protein